MEYLRIIEQIIKRPLTVDEKKQALVKLTNNITPELIQSIAIKLTTDPDDVQRDYRMRILTDDGVEHKYKADDKIDNDVSVNTILSIKSIQELMTTAIKDSSHAALPYRIRSNHYYTYIMLDSDNCHAINDARDNFKWLIQENNTVIQPGIINVTNELRNVVAMRMSYISLNHMSKQLAQDYEYSHRFGIGFDEFVSQAFITPYGNKFQFISSIKYLDGAYGTNITLSTYDYNRGWFRFREPITKLDTLTMNIYNLNTDLKISFPDSYEVFDATKQSGVTIYPRPQYDYISYSPGSYSSILGSYDNTIRIDQGAWMPINYNYIYFIRNNIHSTSVGEPVLFSDLNTGDPALDALYNGQTKKLTYVTFDHFTVDGEVGSIFPSGYYDFKITLLYKPRFICALELVCENS